MCQPQIPYLVTSYLRVSTNVHCPISILLVNPKVKIGVLCFEQTRSLSIVCCTTSSITPISQGPEGFWKLMSHEETQVSFPLDDEGTPFPQYVKESGPPYSDKGPSIPRLGPVRHKIITRKEFSQLQLLLVWHWLVPKSLYRQQHSFLQDKRSTRCTRELIIL